MSRFEELKTNYEYRKSQLRDGKKLEMFAVVQISNYMTHLQVHKVTYYKYRNENIHPTISYKVRWNDGCFNDFAEYYEPLAGIPYVFREVNDYPDDPTSPGHKDVEFEEVDVLWEQ